MKVFIVVLISSILLLSCATQRKVELQTSKNANDLLIVDCLLPSQIRKLGQMATYLTARRAIKTTAVDCEIRGGEYVAYDRANYMTALNIWLPKAQAGDPEAQNYVGEIYEKGLGSEPDYEMAYLWYKKAAQQGFSKAQMNLGFLYEKGLGVPKNKAKALELYHQSSKLNELKIPFASTMTSEAENRQQSSELKLLKSALNNSYAEATILKNKLLKVQKRLASGKSKLLALEKEIALVKNKIKSSSNGPFDKENIELLKQALNDKKQEIGDERRRLALLENKYKRETAALNTALMETQKRAEQIAAELKKKNDQNKRVQIALLEEKAKLAATEEKLLKVDQLSEQRLQELITLKHKIRTMQSSNTENKQLDVQKKILLYEQERIAAEQTIARLEEENRRIKQVEQQIKEKLAAQGLSNEKIIELQSRLLQQKQLATAKEQSLQQIKVKLAVSEQEKKKLIQMVDTERSEKKKYLADLSRKSDEIEQLRQKLRAEKQRFEAKIKKLQHVVQKEEVVDKPKIEIIDPPFVMTRGVPTVRLRSIVSHREIVGKIYAPGGLLSLSVNDQKGAIDSEGLFKKEVKILGEKTPVQIIAVNNRGDKASLKFILSLDKSAIRSSTAIEKFTTNKQYDLLHLNFGKYYALIIGNNDYQKVPKLDTPEADAREIESVLREKYGFKTKLLLNGTRYQILSELNKLRSTLTEEDNLLIYYAGHGELDKVNMRGHWLPVDADGDNTANWISTVSITDILNAMAVKHVMVVSDSCYSGAMTRSSLARLETGLTTRQKQEWLKAMLKSRSRTVLTSGGLKPVMDGGGGQYSVFANAFITALKSNNSLLEGQTLYREVASNIVGIAAQYGIEQVPEYAPIRHAGHESGEFFFVPKRTM
jgi:hypothetical protein